MMIRFLLTDSRTGSPHTHVRLASARFTLLSLVLAALASLAACGSAAANTPTAPAATNTPSFATVAPGTVLFQSDWSKGLAGWQASDGWTVRDGMLEMDGQDNRTL